MQVIRQKDERPVVRMSVRELVEFLRREDGIDDRISARAELKAMQKGAAIHKRIQAEGGDAYRSEVPLSYCVDMETYTLEIGGRADGVVMGEETLVDEIKGVSFSVDYMSEPRAVHLAQALCYAYMLCALDDALQDVIVQITYVEMDSDQVRRFQTPYTRETLTQYFSDLMKELRPFTDELVSWKIKRDATMETLSFPFPYREGQEALVRSVYRTIGSSHKLYLNAPTGVGKTMAVLYPSIRAIGEGKVSMLFYVTARTVTSLAAVEALSILRKNGLLFRCVQLRAKEKMCPLSEPSCNPDDCAYAKDYYRKYLDAMKDLLCCGEDMYDADVIMRAAKQHMVCPYELSLDMTIYADAIIGDYNYVFDPDVRLKRFFGDGKTKDYIILMDEAHNLVDRAREMYSATIYKKDVLQARRLIKEVSPSCYKAYSKLNKRFLSLSAFDDAYCVIEDDEGFCDLAIGAMQETERLFDRLDDAALKKDLLPFYFMLRSFVRCAEESDEHDTIYLEKREEEGVLIRVFCIDPSVHIARCLEDVSGAVFFSATLLPIRYYLKLLGGDEEDYTVYAPSPFRTDHRLVLMADDISTRYTDRGEETYRRIARCIKEVALSNPGNYMVFFPSHKMMQDVFCLYRDQYDDPSVDWVVQGRYMGEEDRQIFLENFDQKSERSLIGFCVMGGLFSEGIDLVGEKLIGAIVCGTGFPQVGTECEILKEGYERLGHNGFDYTYRFPGLIKVLQAGGRVIRTDTDKGVIVLLDRRFLERSYDGLFPREWKNRAVMSIDAVPDAVRAFFNS